MCMHTVKFKILCAYRIIILILAQPLHWVYSHDKMKEVLSGGLDPAFSPVSHNPFYTIETGSQSPYGDQLFVQLKCLVKYKGLYIPNITAAYANNYICMYHIYCTDLR